MRSFIKRNLIRVLAPIIASEVNRKVVELGQDLDWELQVRARSESADFALSHLTNAKPFRDKTALLEWTLSQACLRPDDLVLEFGVWRGESLRKIARQVSNTVHGFDSFEGLPEQWRWHFEKGFFEVNELPEVPTNVRLWKGWFKDTLPDFLKEHSGSVGFVHIDCDLYSSTKDIFDLLGDRFRAGTVLLFDEYFNYTGWQEGEHKAFLEYIAKSGRSFDYIGFCSCNEQVAVMLK